MIVGALVGWMVPVGDAGSDARAVGDFRHALGAYLDVLVLLLAAHEGTESAMDLAARAGTGPAFAELRRAVSQARLSGEGEKARRAALADANAIEGAKEGEAEQRRRSAIAEAVEREGTADAAAILARGQAEAASMRAKADGSRSSATQPYSRCSSG